MQINLPIEPSAPSPGPQPQVQTQGHGAGARSFEDCLGPKPAAPNAKGSKADCAAPSKPVKAAAPDEPEAPEEKKDADLDPETAAALAAMTMNAPVQLPALPTVDIEAVPAESGSETLTGAPVAEPVVTTGRAAVLMNATALETEVQSAASAASATPEAAPEREEASDANSAPAVAGETPAMVTEAEPEPVIASVRSVPREKLGTAAAMDRGAMSTALLNRQAKAKAAGNAVGDKSPVLGSIPRPAAAGHAAPAPAARSITPEPVTPVNAVESVNGLEAASTNTPNLSSPLPLAAITKAERVAFDANVTLDHVQRLTEHLQATGRQQVELEVKLHDDSKVTISLQMERGELKTVFKTDSAGLRDALAQNWGQVADKKGDGSVRLTPPVFEASDARNGFSGDFRQQGRQERAYADAESESTAFTFRPMTKSSPVASTTAVAVSSQSALELYA